MTEPVRSSALPCSLPQDIPVEAVPQTSAVPEVSQGIEPVETDADVDRDINMKPQENSPCIPKTYPQRNRKPPEKFMWD